LRTRFRAKTPLHVRTLHCTPPPRPATPFTPELTFPDHLPVSARRADIAAALNAHQVVIVCGETGSGKTTQLPKIALAAGRGVKHGKVGMTQPRRIAAKSVANRLAEETKTRLGGFIGWQVRFTDQVGADTRIKVMTDGILLAETQSDPEFRAYDTLILDEAHERSLNIDFLLGYLKTLLPRRPDLKLIISSATLEADRFSAYFNGAPVIEVSGRTYPVEMRYRTEQAAGCDVRLDERESMARTPTAARKEATRPRRRTRHRQPAAARRRRTRRRRAGRHPGVPARRARDPRCAGIAAQTSPATHRNSAAVRAAVGERTGTSVQVAQPAAASCWPPTWRKPRSPCPASAMWWMPGWRG
jgi:HrpA-like RNA helicase